jgi:hypothetical protein
LNSIAENPEEYLAAACELLMAEGMADAAEILRISAPKVEETGYDNWNGGTTIWTIHLLVDPAIYAQLGAKRGVLEEQINQRLKPILDQFTSDWYGVTIAPMIKPRPDWRHAKDDVSRITRQNIIDGLKIDHITWSGRLEEVEFLQRIFDLKSLPSSDSRFKNAADDIWQHRVNNPSDWPDEWIYDDARFNLQQCPTDTFLRFLSEMVHPVVRADRNEALKLVRHFNDQLRNEGWSLVEEEKIAGHPRFVGKRIGGAAVRSMSRARTVADALDAGWMQKEIERLENAVERDPSLAIGTAKDLVETAVKVSSHDVASVYLRNPIYPNSRNWWQRN